MLNIFVGFEQSNRYVISAHPRSFSVLYPPIDYSIVANENEDVLGYIAEEPRGLLSMFSRQLFRTHRPFRALVMDRFGSPILWVSTTFSSQFVCFCIHLRAQLRRPFSWINSRMFVQKLHEDALYTAEGEPVLDTFAEVQQRWHLWRRRYDLFLRYTSFPTLFHLFSNA